MKFSLIYLFLSSLLVIFFLYTVYNVPIMLSGARNLLRSRKKSKKRGGVSSVAEGELPFVSVLVYFLTFSFFLGSRSFRTASIVLFFPFPRNSFVISGVEASFSRALFQAPERTGV